MCVLQNEESSVKIWKFSNKKRRIVGITKKMVMKFTDILYARYSSTFSLYWNIIKYHQLSWKEIIGPRCQTNSI